MIILDWKILNKYLNLDLDNQSADFRTIQLPD